MNHMTSKNKQISGSYLTPRKEAVKINGKLFYSEGDQSWNIIRLKKEVLHEFPQLKEKRSSFSYVMVIGKNHDEIKQVLSEVKEAVPVLLFFNKENQEN